MKRALSVLTAGLVLTLGACVPQFIGGAPLSVEVESEHVLVITLTEATGQPVFDVHFDFSRVDALLSSSIPLECIPIQDLSLSCVSPEAQQHASPVTVVVRADTPGDVAVAAWWSVPGGRDRIARIRVTD